MNQLIPLSESAQNLQWQRGPLPASDYQALIEAVHYLENPGLAARLSHYIGMPVEKALASLPDNLVKPVTQITQDALNKALNAALLTLPKERNRKSTPRLIHNLLAGTSGALGGSFGIASLAVELPVSATLMLRAIAATAHEQGENINEPDSKLACLEVFAFGGPADKDDNSEIGYYAVRAFLAKTMEESAKHLMKKGLAKEGAPALVRFINAVSQRFSVQVSQKFALQALPAVGAFSGATVNILFMSHFQDMAYAHFTIRRLERAYGKERVRSLYEGVTARQEELSNGKA
ncbi:MAG TPA: EcsC family protein [Methylothermaceae bacterium]|nr:EcsC family protein [Methylothermaceae bacterium]